MGVIGAVDLFIVLLGIFFPGPVWLGGIFFFPLVALFLTVFASYLLSRWELERN